jgi:hypothetical protein
MLENFQKRGSYFRNFVIDFLIADYSSWSFLNISNFKQGKAGNEPEKVTKKYLYKKRSIEIKKTQ